jgi:undecaprenyl-diphosphatase
VSPRTLGHPSHRLAPLVTATAAALVFAALFILVRLQWIPLESVDHGAAARINRLIARDDTLVTVVKAVTLLGSTAVLSTVTGAAAVGVAILKRWRLAIYLLATGAGALILDRVLKSLVGRVRPVVVHPIACGTGSSFPSGHSLGSIVYYGAILLVFLPVARGRWRTAIITVVVTLRPAPGTRRSRRGYTAPWRDCGSGASAGARVGTRRPPRRGCASKTGRVVAERDV